VVACLELVWSLEEGQEVAAARARLWEVEDSWTVVVGMLLRHWPSQQLQAAMVPDPSTLLPYPAFSANLIFVVVHRGRALDLELSLL